MEISINSQDKVKLAFKYCAHKLRSGRRVGSDKVPVTTKSGPIVGVKRKTLYGDKYYSFEGIPFAKPPIGDLRFKSPQEVEPWTKIRNCTKCGPKPIQKHIFLDKTEGSEDCLYLNVYSKDIFAQSPLPVMVWIFGGGFQLGEATRDVHSPDYFMMEDVVIFVINYRLGPLGFLSLEDPDVNVPGNAGLKDQAMALKWIKRNCHVFGGDSSNITVFGVSAGSASTHFLMLSKATENLFHKAILMSGTALSPWSLIHRNETNWTHMLVKSMGYSGVNYNDKDIFKFLQNARGKDIIKCSGNLFGWEERSLKEIYAFGPVIEPYRTDDGIIYGHPKDIMRNCWSKNIPIIIGTTSFEGLILYPEIRKRPQAIAQLSTCPEQLVPMDLDPSTRNIKHLGQSLRRLHFGRNKPSELTQFEYLDMCSYKFWWHPLYRTVKSRMRYAPTVPTYLYRFDFDSKYFNHCRILLCGKEMRGVCHADDLSYLFVNAISTKLKKTSREYRTMRRMVTMWTQFALYGNPNNILEMKEINWQPVNGSVTSSTVDGPLQCLNISDDLRIMNFPEYRKLKIWDSIYNEEDLV